MKLFRKPCYVASKTLFNCSKFLDVGGCREWIQDKGPWLQVGTALAEISLGHRFPGEMLEMIKAPGDSAEKVFISSASTPRFGHVGTCGVYSGACQGSLFWPDCWCLNATLRASWFELTTNLIKMQISHIICLTSWGCLQWMSLLGPFPQIGLGWGEEEGNMGTWSSRKRSSKALLQVRKNPSDHLVQKPQLTSLCFYSKIMSNTKISILFPLSRIWALHFIIDLMSQICFICSRCGPKVCIFVTSEF